MSVAHSPELASPIHRSPDKGASGPTSLETGIAKKAVLDETKKAYDGALSLMGAVSPADQLLWSSERKAAFKMLSDRKADTLDANKTRVELSMTIVDSNNRTIDRKIAEGIPANEMISFLEDAANKDPNPDSDARKYLNSLKKQLISTTDLEDLRFPQQERNAWIAERIKKEAYFRSLDERGKDASGKDKTQAELEADARIDLANRKELILPELTEEELQAVEDNEIQIQRAEDAAILANSNPDLARLMIDGLLKKKNANQILSEKVNSVLDPASSATNEQKIQAIDIQRTLSFLEKTTLVDKGRKSDRDRIAVLNAQIRYLDNQRNSLTRIKDTRVASAVANEWQANRFYTNEDIANNPDRVLEDYFKKVIRNESRPEVDSEGVVRQVNMRDAFLDQLERRTFMEKAGSALPPGASEFDILNFKKTPAGQEATKAAEKVRNETNRKLKIENVKGKILAARGPGALIALMMLGKSIKSMLSQLTDTPQQGMAQ